MDANSYNDIVYSLYSLGNSGIDYQDLRYRQLLSALNGIRSRRNENVQEFTSLTGTGQNPFNPLQFSVLLNQIDAYVNYVTKSRKIPAALLRKCSLAHFARSVGEPEPDGEAAEEAEGAEEEASGRYDITGTNDADLVDVSDIFHRKNECWGPGFFWLDYRDNLEQNKLSFFLGAITNVKTMTQYIIQNNANLLNNTGTGNSDNCKYILDKFEQMFRDIGLYSYLLSFLKKDAQARGWTLPAEDGRPRKRREAGPVQRSAGEAKAEPVPEAKPEGEGGPPEGGRKEGSEAPPDGAGGEKGAEKGEASQEDAVLEIMFKYDYEQLLLEILKLEKKINLLLLQKNVKSILNLTRLVNPLFDGGGCAGDLRPADYKRNLLDHIKSSTQHFKDQHKFKRKFIVLSNKFVYNASLNQVSHKEVVSEKVKFAIQKDRKSIYNNILATLVSTCRGAHGAQENRIVENVSYNLPASLVGKLRNYQLQGLNWLVSLYNNKLNGILADEMGLGKTIQTISLLIYLKENKGISGSHIVLAPLSTLHSNWKNEFETWFPSCKLCIYEGSKEWRKSLRQKWYEGNKLTFDVLLTSDSFIIKDKNYLKKICWEYLIVDEAHRLKNQNSKLVKVLNQYFIANRRLLLTGTPLQNDLNELWSLLNFIKPQIFNNNSYYYHLFNMSLNNIVKRYDDEGFSLNDQEQLAIVNNIHQVSREPRNPQILKPYLLRREKPDVLDEVPSNDEFIICCPLSGVQTRLYEFFVHKDSPQNKFLQLRKICNHPYLYANSNYPCDDMVVSSCGKMCMLDFILSRLYAVKHRVLIFSQMTSLLDILEVYLSYRNYKYLRLDGSTTSDKRVERLRLFNEPNSEYFVFILSTKAGSLGINLQSADTVIIYDSDWNPQNDIQAQSRVHRIGQKNKVISLRLITPNTIEENILKSTGVKLNQNLLIIQSGNYQNPTDDCDEYGDQLKNVINVRSEYRSDNYGIRDVELLNQVLSRCDEDLKTFALVSYKNFVLNPFPIMRQRVLPPFLFKAISSNKKFHLTDDDRRKLAVDAATWQNLHNDYNIYAASPTLQCQFNYMTHVRNSGGRDPSAPDGGLKHVITSLRVDYPIEYLARVNGGLSSQVFECLVNPDLDEEAANELAARRLGVLNRAIAKELRALMSKSAFTEFYDLPNRSYLSDYYDKIKSPICLNDMLALCKDNAFKSLFDLKDRMQLLTSNARAYNGSDSFLFHKSLNLNHVLMARVTFRVLLEFVKMSERERAEVLEQLLSPYFN